MASGRRPDPRTARRRAPRAPWLERPRSSRSGSPTIRPRSSAGSSDAVRVLEDHLDAAAVGPHGSRGRALVTSLPSSRMAPPVSARSAGAPPWRRWTCRSRFADEAERLAGRPEAHAVDGLDVRHLALEQALRAPGSASSGPDLEGRGGHAGPCGSWASTRSASWQAVVWPRRPGRTKRRLLAGSGRRRSAARREGAALDRLAQGGHDARDLGQPALAGVPSLEARDRGHQAARVGVRRGGRRDPRPAASSTLPAYITITRWQSRRPRRDRG
jgi:hypothetical protein